MAYLQRLHFDKAHMNWASLVTSSLWRHAACLSEIITVADNRLIIQQSGTGLCASRLFMQYGALQCYYGVFGKIANLICSYWFAVILIFGINGSRLIHNNINVKSLIYILLQAHDGKSRERVGLSVTSMPDSLRLKVWLQLHVASGIIMVPLLLRRRLDNMQNSLKSMMKWLLYFMRRSWHLLEVLIVLFFSDYKILVNDYIFSYHHGFSEFNLIVSNIVSRMSLHLNLI